MSAIAEQVAAPAGRLLERLEHAEPRRVLAGFVVAQWLATLGVALAVRHNGWLFYQGGDQLWHYVTAWVMGQGRLPHTSVGYAWSIVLLPFALVGGPNLISPLPFIVLMNVLILMPIALLASYGIGRRIGGRLFGYWVALLWIAVPLIGIRYVEVGYHQRYTELLLPQSLGLTVMSDFPSLVVSVVAAYFTVRAIQENEPWDAVLAGLLAGVALAIKPSNAPLVVGIGLGLLAARRVRSLGLVAAGLLPSLAGLAIWKGVGEGNLPILRNGAAGSLTAHAAPVLALSLNNHYIHPSWSYFNQQLNELGQYVWSVRLLEWLAIAGTIGLLRRSVPIGLLFGGWFFSNIFAKWMTPGRGTIADSDLLRQSIPTIPAALMLLAGVILLLPRLPQRLPHVREGAWGTHRIRVGLTAAILVLFFVVPVALAAGLPALSNSDTISYYTQTGASLSAPFGVDAGWKPSVVVHGRRVVVSWRALRPLGAAMGYNLLRAPAGQELTCDATGGGAQCILNGTVISATHATQFVDAPPKGRWTYRVLAVASWTNDPTAGNIFVAGTPITVDVTR